MITVGILRQIMRQLLGKLSADNIDYDDIRYIKADQGQFPVRIIKNGTDVKTLPYIPESDTFILFDVEPGPVVISTPEDDKTINMWRFKLVVNIYGREADSLIHIIMNELRAFPITSWLSSQGISVEQSPEEINLLDGFENQLWWIRRQITIDFNIHQEIEFKHKGRPIDTIKYERVEG